MQKLDSNVDLVLSENAIKYTVEQGRPLIALDFVGYMGFLDPTFDKVMYLVDIHGNFELVSCDKTRPRLPLRLKKKWMRWCIKNCFLEYIIEPFPEFSIAYNLPFNKEDAVVLPVNLIQSIECYNKDGVNSDGDC